MKPPQYVAKAAAVVVKHTQNKTNWTAHLMHLSCFYMLYFRGGKKFSFKQLSSYDRFPRRKIFMSINGDNDYH